MIRYSMGIALMVLVVTHAKVQHVNTVSEFDNVLKNNSFVVAEFYPEWGLNKTIDPIFEQISDEYKNIPFLKVDIEKLETLANRYNVNEMPAFLYFKNGKEAARHTGSRVTTGEGFLVIYSMSLDKGMRQYIAKYFGIGNVNEQVSTSSEKEEKDILRRIKSFFTSLFS